MATYAIRAGDTHVEVWTGYRVQFGGMERHDWQKMLKAELKVALSQLDLAADVPFCGYYATTDTIRSDAENSLFTNLLESMPTNVKLLRFERGTAAPPPPPKPLEIVGSHMHYYRYEVNAPWRAWQRDELLAKWSRVPRRLPDDGSARPAWYALRCASAQKQITFTDAMLPADANFGIKLVVHAASQGPRNAVTYSERVVDGIIAAFHNDGVSDELVAALAPKFPKLTEQELRHALAHPAGPLFDSQAIITRGPFVQFSPADERCCMGEVRIRRDSAERWPAISGELFTVQEVNP